MSFTYSDGLSTNRDKARFLVGDTVSTYAVFTDEEIAAALTRQGDNLYKAVGQLLQTIAASPGLLVSVHDASGRVFVVSQLANMFSTYSAKWMGSG
jgi:hypothetical protein